MRFTILCLTLTVVMAGPAAASDFVDLAQPALAADQECDRSNGFPFDAPCTGTIIVVDTFRNVLSLYRDGELLGSAPVATGMNKLLIHGNRKWLFRTPHGRLRVLRKLTDPVWTKPDWAFVEEGKPVPPAGSPQRRVRGVLGRYALDLGEGILIHGTRELDSLGRNASHGCIRVGGEMLARLHAETKVGTEVFIYASEPETDWTVTDARSGRTVTVESVRELLGALATVAVAP